VAIGRDKTKAVGLVFAKSSIQVFDLAKTGTGGGRPYKTRAAEFVFAKPSTWMLDLAKTGAGGSWP